MQSAKDSQVIKVAIAGVNGRMGRAALAALSADEGLSVVGAFGREGAGYVGENLSKLAPDAKQTMVSVSNSFEEMLKAVKPDVVLDFMVAEASLELAKKCILMEISPVIGSSGLPALGVKELASLAEGAKQGALIVPNFSLGAVLMMEFAKQASKYFANSEVVELHHMKKLDAPSGTAMHTLDKMAASGNKYNMREVEEKEIMPGSRGARHESGLRVHSLRLPGLISHQEVFFGAEGELLTIKHDSFNTACFNKGMVMAVKAVTKLQSLKIGLENIL